MANHCRPKYVFQSCHFYNISCGTFDGDTYNGSIARSNVGGRSNSATQYSCPSPLRVPEHLRAALSINCDTVISRFHHNRNQPHLVTKHNIPTAPRTNSMTSPRSRSQYRSIDNLTTATTTTTTTTIRPVAPRAPIAKSTPPPTPPPTSRISSLITLLLTRISQYHRFLGVFLLRVRDVLRPYIIAILFSSAFLRFVAIIRASIRVRVSLRKSYPRVVCKVRV